MSNVQNSRCSQCAIRSECIMGTLPSHLLAQADQVVRTQRHGPGHVISPEGRTARGITIVKIGQVLSYRCGLDGVQRPLGIAARADCFGLPGMFGQPNQITAVSYSECRTCDVPYPFLRDLLRQWPEFHLHLTACFAQQTGRLADWSAVMRLQGVVAQLAHVLLLLARGSGSPVVELPTHALIATLLGTTRETIVRGLARLEQTRGIERFERKRCLIHRHSLLSQDSEKQVDARASAQQEAVFGKDENSLDREQLLAAAACARTGWGGAIALLPGLSL